MKSKKALMIIFIILIIVLLSAIAVLSLNHIKISKEYETSISKLEKDNEKLLADSKKKDEKISYLEIENTTLKDMNEEQFQSLKEAEKNSELLLQELEETNQNINKRVQIINSHRQTCNATSDTVFLYFNDLSNVEKIHFSLNQDEFNIIGINDNQKSIPVILDKDQNKGVVSFWTYDTVKLFNKNIDEVHETMEKRVSSMSFEIYYTDGRTETITTNVGCG